MANYTFISKDTTVVTGSTITLDFSCQAGTTLLVAGIAYNSLTSRTGTPTFNGIGMSQAGPDLHAPSEVSAQMYYMVDPPAGATYSLSLPNSTGATVRVYASAWQSGAGFTSSLDSAVSMTGSTASVSNSISISLAEELLIDILAHGHTNTITLNNRTLLFRKDEGAWNTASQYEITSGTGAVLFTYRAAGVDNYAHIIAAFKQVASSSPATDVSVNSATHSHTADSPTITVNPAQNVSPSNASHGHLSTSPNIYQLVDILSDNASHNHSTTSPVVSELNVLGDNASHGHSSTEPLVNQGNPPKDIASDNAAHVLTSDECVIEYGSTDIAPEDSAHNIFSDESTITVSQVTIDPLFRGHIRRRGRYYRYIEPEVQEAQTQDELAVIAAKIAQDEIEKDRKLEQRKLELAQKQREIININRRISTLQRKSEQLLRQSEILKELVAIQKKRMQDEEDVATLLMLL